VLQGGQEKEGMMARTWQKDRAAEKGQLRWEKHGRAAMTFKMEHSWAQSAMDRWIDTDGIVQYFWSHFHQCYRSIG
jgi:hypothetical protein